MSQIESLYLHFPHCRHLCNYCDFYKTLVSDNRDYSSFHEYLRDSWAEHENLLTNHEYNLKKLNTLYLGGGTPSLWDKTGAEFLSDFFNQNGISIDSDTEFTFEVNPGSWTEEGLQQWIELGANRFSLGVQTLNPNVVKFLDRVHSIDEVYETLNYFKDNQLSFSVDFMLGLPDSVSQHRDVIAELSELIDKYEPEHFSLYILTVGKKYIHFDKLPDDGFIEKEYLAVANFLKSKGYQHYEVSNFAKPGKESRHNFAYWRGESVAALGPSATGYLDKGIRYKWKASSAKYEIENLNEQEKKLESLYLGLRTNRGIDWKDFTSSMSEELKKIESEWLDKELAYIENERFLLTSKGYLVMDGLINQLFSVPGLL